MRVEIWSDVVCPYCYIGKRQFEKALKQFSHKADVEVHYRSFELNTGSPRAADVDLHQFLADHKGMEYSEAKALNEEVARYAESVGLHYDLERVHPANSFDAHRLVHLAAKHDLAAKMVERLHSAYFVEAIDIGKKENLVRLAAEVGLEKDEAEAALLSEAFASGVRTDEAEADVLGIRAVPYFFFDRKLAVTGAQSSDVFLEALKQAWGQRRRFR